MKEHAAVKGRASIRRTSSRNLRWCFHFPSQRSSPTAPTSFVSSVLQTAVVPDSITTVAEAASCIHSHRIMSNSPQSIHSKVASSPTFRNGFPKKTRNRQTVMRRLIMTTEVYWHSSNDYRVLNFDFSTDAPTIRSALVNLLPHGSVRLRVGKEDYEDELWVLGDDTDNTETSAPARTQVGSHSWPFKLAARGRR